MNKLKSLISKYQGRVSHGLMGFLGSFLPCVGFMSNDMVITSVLISLGISTVTIQIAYQFAGYWQQQDTLKKDLREVIVGWMVGLIGLVLMIGV